MTEMKPPTVTEKPIQVLTEDRLRELLGTCSGKTFVERRDNAIIRLFVDTGVRRAEMAGLGVDDIDVREQVAQVFGKGRRPRSVPFGVRTTQALSPTSENAAATRMRSHRPSGSGRRASGH
jgi:site-specific recombinase XerD